MDTVKLWMLGVAVAVFVVVSIVLLIAVMELFWFLRRQRSRTGMVEVNAAVTDDDRPAVELVVGQQSIFISPERTRDMARALNTASDKSVELAAQLGKERAS